jgi:hypothetical protein
MDTEVGTYKYLSIQLDGRESIIRPTTAPHLTISVVRSRTVEIATYRTSSVVEYGTTGARGSDFHVVTYGTTPRI